ncbi:MAG: endonuclease/exonuclease/phosphatase family protein [Candidatus Paceibacterota bacterium]
MRIKFLNLNIWYGKLLESVVEFIKRENPDVVSLQEVCDGEKMSPKWLNSWGTLKKELSYKHVSFAPTFYVVENGIKVNQGQAILSKYPILNEETFFYDVPYGEFIFSTEDFSLVPRNLQYVILNVQGKKLNIFNTQGIWDKDKSDSKRKIKMSEKIIEQVSDKNHVILSGDFNITPKTNTIHNIEKILNNPFKDKLNTTVNFKRKNKANEKESVIDMIFISSDIKILDSYCPQVDVSDHMPLIIVFEI